MMKSVTYAATPGLDQFPEPERFRVWRSTHERLMGTDPAYQRQVRGFHLRTLVATVLFVSLSVVLGRFEWPPFVVQLAVYLVLTVIFVAYTLRTSHRKQLFQNERIGKVLHEHAV